MAATILVADDEPYLLDLLTAILAGEGYLVLTASDGVQALTLAEQAHPALILSDIMMPRLSGVDLAARLRARTDAYRPPILLLSAVLPLHLPARTAFLAKPFDVDVLLATVARLLTDA